MELKLAGIDGKNTGGNWTAKLPEKRVCHYSRLVAEGRAF